MGGAILVLHVHNESSASGQAPEEEGPGSWGRQGGTMSSAAPEEEGPGRQVQRSQLRLAPPNRIPFVGNVPLKI